MFWHNKENSSKTDEVKEPPAKLPIKDRLGPNKGTLANSTNSESNISSKAQEKVREFVYSILLILLKDI